MGTRSRLDYIMTPAWPVTGGYHPIKTFDMVAGYHDMFALRFSVCERVAPQSRRRGTLTSCTGVTWRRAAEGQILEAGAATDKLQKWGDILKGNIGDTDDG